MSTHVRTTGVHQLVPGREIAVIACVASTGGGRRASRSARVRWGALPELGFPEYGWRLSQTSVSDQQSQFIGNFELPASTDWAAFEADALSRRPPSGTAPWFPVFDEASLGWLPPLIRLADRRTMGSERDSLTTSAAAFFGNTHEEDPELRQLFWPSGDPPPLSDLLSDPASEQRVVAFYEAQCIEFLLVLALRFEYALVLGLGTVVSLPSADPVYFEVAADWPGSYGKAESDPADTNAACSVGPPKWLLASRGPGSVSHPAFAAWPNWTPPAELAPEDPAGNPLPATAIVPRAPASFSSLEWPGQGTGGDIIGYGAVLWKLERFDHGAASAALQQPPALPSGALFVQIPYGELLMRSDNPPQFVDYPGMAWPPLEGWYHYRLRTVNLLGAVSSAAAETALHHHDDIAPPPPRARAVIEGGLELAPGATTASVDLRIDWDAAEDFNGPDAVEFRVAAQWIVQQAVSVHVESATDADTLHADLVVTSLPGANDDYAGLLLSTADGDFPIASNTSGSQATIRVNKAGDTWPAAGEDGYILVASAPSTRKRVAKLARSPAAPATVASITAVSPTLEFAPTAAAATPLPPDASGRIYLHALQASFDYTQSAGSFKIDEPDGGPALDAWQRLQALSDPAAALDGSPAIVFPPHELTVNVAVPSGLRAGLLTLSVTAADAASYVKSPVLPVANQSLANAKGNESTRTDVIVSVRGTDPPQPPQTPTYTPGTITWATSAAAYSEEATYVLGWSTASGAVRYEVWRALEGGLSGASASTSDGDLRSLATGQPDAFELCSDRVFATSFTDSLPGRAPTRALYVVRSVDIGGNRSQPSDVIGPVWVPDVRPPAPPNLTHVAATSLSEADSSIALEWTLGGPAEGVRFDVEVRSSGDTWFAGAGSVAAGTAPDATGRWRFVHGSRVPGRVYDYRLIAVREALDPIDASGATKRDIAGPPSQVRSAFAITAQPLTPPDNLAAYVGGDDTVVLSWNVEDDYESQEIRRMGDGEYAFRTVGTVDGTTGVYEDGNRPPGTYSYKVKAIGVRREAESTETLQVTVS